MHGRVDRPVKRVDRSNRNPGIGVLALPALLAIAMVALALTEPSASRWISESAQAEFASSILTSEPAPTQIAQPVGTVRTVRAN